MTKHGVAMRMMVLSGVLLTSVLAACAPQSATDPELVVKKRGEVLCVSERDTFVSYDNSCPAGFENWPWH